MRKIFTPGDSPQSDELCSSTDEPHQVRAGLPIPKPDSTILRIPKAFGKLIEADYKAGKFKDAFGKWNQKKAREAVIWLLNTIYNRTALRGISQTQLKCGAMREKFGKSHVIKWSSIKEFCLEQKYIGTDSKYIVGRKSYAYWLNPDILLGDESFRYYHIIEATISKKLEKEEKRFNNMLNTHWKGTNRMYSVGITRANLEYLWFDKAELNAVCLNMLNVSLDLLLEWVQEVKDYKEKVHADSKFFDNFSFSPFKEGIEEEKEGSTPSISEREREYSKGEVIGRYIQHIYHSDAPFYSSENVEEKERRRSRDQRRRQLIRSLTAILLGLSNDDVKVDKKGGRLYSPVTSLKREARETLRYRNEMGGLECLVNFDVRTSQPWGLGITILEDCQKRKIAVPDDVYNYLEVVEEQDFYYAVLEFAGKECTKENRDAIKKDVMLDLFKDRKSSLPFTDAGRFIKAKFPAVWRWINKNKGLGEKSDVPIRLQRSEADFFVDVVIPELTAKGIWCLTIHDSVLVREKDAELVKEYLQKRIQEFFGRSPKIEKEDLGRKVTPSEATKQSA